MPRAKDFPTACREWRAAHGLTQEAWAAQMELSPGYVAQLESGHKTITRHSPAFAKLPPELQCVILDEALKNTEAEAVRLRADLHETLKSLRRSPDREDPGG